MIVRLTDDYYVKVDDKNFILYKASYTKNKRTGNYANIGFFSNMKSVLKKMLREDLSNDQELTLQGYLKHLETQEEQINAYVDKIYVEKKLSEVELKKRVKTVSK